MVISTYIFSTKLIYNEGKEKLKDQKVLPDFGFDIIEDRRHDKYLYKIKEVLNIFYLFIFFISIYNDKKALLEYVLTVGIILIMKNILFVSTILPDPSQKCKKFCAKKFYQGTCFDLHISSHSTLLFASLFVLINNKICNGNTFLVAIMINMIIVYLILTLRQHYSMDILNALFYTYFVNYYVRNNLVPKILA